jgi:chemotaxis protein methyltransferase WspC
VVFCRNLLIYFDTASRARVLATLASLLKPGGFLFVGAAEAGVLLGHGFEPTKWPMSFSFRKDPVERSKPSQSIPLSPSLPPRHVLKRSEVAGVRRRKKPEAAVLRTDGLAEAQRLADQGRIEEAAVACQAHLRLHGPSAPAFYLFGLLRDACGNSVDAETYYRKALYLDPEHNDAIMHLALLMDGRERPADALVLRKRAKRLTSKSV